MSIPSHSQLIADARDRFMRRLANGPLTFTESIRGLPLPDGIDGRVFGAMVAQLHRDRIIESVGYVPSSTPCCHSRLWRLADQSKGAK